MNDFSSRQFVLSVIGISILIIIVVGVSYAVFSSTLIGTKENKISTGSISMSYIESTNGISLTNAMPIEDEEGKNLASLNEIFDFNVSVSVAGMSNIKYEVVATKIDGLLENIDDKYVRLYLEKKASGEYTSTPITNIPQPFIPLENDSELGSPTGSMILYNGQFLNDSSSLNKYSEDFRLRMWLSKDAIIDDITRIFQIRIDIHSKAV